MAYTADILDSLVPITQFNRGQASRIFDRLHNENQLIVLKNNQPAAIILSPSEFQRLSEIEEDYTLLLEATRRLKDNPLPVQQGGYGKPLGNKSGTNLTNLLKIKFRDIGIRVVYKVEYTATVMKIIVISARADEQVYIEATKRRTKHNL